MKKWYLIKTKPRQEINATANLEKQNYHVYCPWAIINKKSVVMFPGYLFIQLDDKTQNWSPIRSTRGVVNFVRFGLNYAKVPDDVLEFIQFNEQSTSEKIQNLNSFRKGDKVQITDGVFKNCIAIFESFKSDERIVLLMKLMGQEQTINVKKQSLIGL